MIMKFSAAASATMGALAVYLCLGAAPAAADEVSMSLITKTNENPVFVIEKNYALELAKQKGIKLLTFAGKYDGDNASQVTAIEDSLAAGVKAILIIPNDTTAIVPQIQAARKAGVVVEVIDSPLHPANAADGTFATDNYDAGLAIGRWAKAYLGDKAATAKIAMLDADTMMVTNDVLRDTGFLDGFGIAIPNKKVWGSEKDPRIAGHDVTKGSVSGGQQAMENLLQKEPGINLVYTMNEQAAAGAAQALKSAGREKDVILVSVDGTCQGIEMVKNGTLAATAMQFWLDMVKDAMDAAYDKVTAGKEAAVTPGLDYFNTGVKLLTDHAVAGVPSVDDAEALKLRGSMCSKS
jgi:fructose transport system substrate-binding protein